MLLSAQALADAHLIPPHTQWYHFRHAARHVVRGGADGKRLPTPSPFPSLFLSPMMKQTDNLLSDHPEWATLDFGRTARTGFPEVVFCQGKPDEALVEIYRKLAEATGAVFGTRADARQAALVAEALPGVRYDPISRVLALWPEPPKAQGLVAVCSGGTADMPVAEEVAQTAEFFGARVERFYDVGVSGLHRLLSRIDAIRRAHCVVAVAGMEGALASVLGGLVEVPVIAVPTSVGYGANFQGLSALLSMLNSCANGVATVNIDNGYGAGYLATQINRLACRTPA